MRYTLSPARFGRYRRFLLSRAQFEAFYGTGLLTYSLLLAVLGGLILVRGSHVAITSLPVLGAGLAGVTVAHAIAVIYTFASDYPASTRGYCRYLGFKTTDFLLLVLETTLLPNLLCAGITLIVCRTYGMPTAALLAFQTLVLGIALTNLGARALFSGRFAPRTITARSTPLRRARNQRHCPLIELARKDLISAGAPLLVLACCIALCSCALLQLISAHPGLSLVVGFSLFCTGLILALSEADATEVGAALWRYYPIPRQQRMISKMIIPCALAFVGFVVVCLLGIAYSPVPFTVGLFIEAVAGLLYCLILSLSIVRLVAFVIERHLPYQLASIAIYLLAIVPFGAPAAAACIQIIQRKDPCAAHR